MHTELKAKSLWCPMVRASDGEHPTTSCAINVAEEHGPNALQSTWSNCVGSACAMWRWVMVADSRRTKCQNTSAKTVEEAGPPPEGSWDFVPDDDEGNIAMWVESEESSNTRSRGGCGLAGFGGR